MQEKRLNFLGMELGNKWLGHGMRKEKAINNLKKNPINAKYCEIIAGRIGEFEYHTIQREGVPPSLTVF